jgi:hypothetical protein
MAEAIYLKRFYKKNGVYLASLDYDFIPNPIQIETYKSPFYEMNYDKLDSGMRDALHKKFGFYSDLPKNIIAILDKKGYK